MNREVFMAELKELLTDMSQAERDEAISYYEEYFADAGAENEAKVIAALGSPQQVAATIKAGLSEEAENAGEFSERGYSDPYCEMRDEIAAMGETEKRNRRPRRFEWNKSMWILILILCIFALPVLAPLCAGIGGTIVGIAAAAAAVLFAAMIAGVAMILVGAAVFIAGILTLTVSGFTGIALIGAALLMLGLGILFAILGVFIVVKVLPPLIRSILQGVRKIFSRKVV